MFNESVIGRGMMTLMQDASSLSVSDIRRMADAYDGELVKAVVDVGRDKLIVDMDYHVDGEQYLLTEGSRQTDLWGINLHPGAFGTDDFVEFDSIINLRPRQNRSRGVEDADLRERITRIVMQTVHE